MNVVLLADNDLRFLKTQAEFLTEAGYKVVPARSLAEAERLLDERRIHMAILDMRMVNNFDPKDTSGLLLAKKSKYRRIHKIILTDYPTVETVREALSGDVDGIPPATEYVDKHEGPKALIQALEKSFKRHVQLNESLVIQFGERDLFNFFNLATLLDPTLSGERLENHAAELKDLFCQTFYEKTEIKIERSLWKSEGRAALVVFAFAPGKHVQAQIVVYGQNGLVVHEADRYKEFAPDAPGVSGTVLVRISQTLHFAANVYALAGTNIENVYTLAESYRELPEKTFKSSLEHLFSSTLAAWRQGKSIPDGEQSLATLYQKELGFNKKAMTVSEVRKRISTAIQQLPRLGVKIEEDFPNLILRFGNQSFSYPDPVPYLYNKFSIEQSQLLVNTPGILSGKNILTDPEGRTWLTEFTHAGLKPLLWNYAALEAVIRFDLIESNNLPELHEMERILVESGFKLCPGDVDAQLRKAVRAIDEVRRLARRASNAVWREYQLGLFYHAAHRLMALDPSKRLTDKELAKTAHVILAQAMICGSLLLENGESESLLAHSSAGIRLDHAAHTVLVDGKRVHLSVQSYELLRYFDLHRGELCTRQQIIEELFKEKYDVKDEKLFLPQRNRLNMSISRLRREIEDDPDNPRYLLNERGVGYRLVS
ncbi:MAG: DNA-binding response regulator [Pyrinomonadaceae bacterium]